MRARVNGGQPLTKPGAILPPQGFSVKPLSRLGEEETADADGRSLAGGSQSCAHGGLLYANQRDTIVPVSAADPTEHCLALNH